jgi:asparagine synthase (glutamine-hydrolysing)
MCGICGVVQLDGAPRPVVAPEVLDRMTDAMVHRGPDDRGTFAEDGVAFGVRRLSIVDVAGGHQPFASEDGRVVAVQNGELYNHERLRRDLQLRGHRFGSRCDTEVIPHLYEQVGPGFPERLRGKFGLALWDGKHRRAVISRDRLGVKPLYYAQAGDLVVFASELKSLLASGLVPLELDLEAIDAFLSFGFVPAPRSPLARVRKLPPGHLLLLADGTATEHAYWHYPQPRPEYDRTADEWAEGLLEVLEDAVRSRLMSDVPLGAMLSGGLDSSLIVALMAKHTSEPVKTFSVGFREDLQWNELADARGVARHYGADHHELELSFTHQTVDLAELVWHLDEPLADLSALGFHALSHLAAQHVTVALSGQGADELLGGYLKHEAASLLGAVPPALRRPLGLLALHGPKRLRRAGATLAARGPAERLLAMSGKVDDALRRELARGALAERRGAALRAVEALGADPSADPLAATLFLDAQLALPDDMLHYFDRASMAHSLEVRVPFLDHHVVEFCARIPSKLKVHGRDRKHLLKKAARGLVPDSVIDKRKIGFFRGATDGWMRAQLYGAMSDHLFGPEPRYAELLDRRAVERLAERQRRGDTRNVHLLLSILMLEIWLSTYLPRATVAPAPPTRERVSVRV